MGRRRECRKTFATARRCQSAKKMTNECWADRRPTQKEVLVGSEGCGLVEKGGKIKNVGPSAQNERCGRTSAGEQRVANARSPADSFSWQLKPGAEPVHYAFISELVAGWVGLTSCGDEPQDKPAGPAILNRRTSFLVMDWQRRRLT